MSTIRFEAESLSVESAGHRRISVDADVDTESILNNFDCLEVVRHFGPSDLLDQIGQDECMAHFGLVPQE